MQAGRKVSHWIWYIFPQLGGLGQSAMTQRYAIADLTEAIEFLRDPVLGPRLVRVTAVVAGAMANGAKLSELMGSMIDAMKLVSSLTLFEAAGRAVPSSGAGLATLAGDCSTILAAAARQGFPRCHYTLEHVTRSR